MAGEIVQVVERQVRNETRSERLCGLQTFFQLGIDTHVRSMIRSRSLGVRLNSIRWSGAIRFRRMFVIGRTAARYLPLERVRRTDSVQFSSESPFTRPNSAVLFVTSRSPSVRA